MAGTSPDKPGHDDFRESGTYSPQLPEPIQIVPCSVRTITSELGVTRREYYVNRAAEFLAASEQIPSDRDALLHMAATYLQIAIESEYHTPPGPRVPPNQAPQISI
jgi:hypothetical protein